MCTFVLIGWVIFFFISRKKYQTDGHLKIEWFWMYVRKLRENTLIQPTKGCVNDHQTYSIGIVPAYDQLIKIELIFYIFIFAEWTGNKQKCKS